MKTDTMLVLSLEPINYFNLFINKYKIKSKQQHGNESFRVVI